MANVRVTLDKSVDAAYIYLADRGGRYAESVPLDSDYGDIVLDFDKDGVLLGVEVLDASTVLAPDLLAQAESTG
jgi:uncharacterized protein YuzE